MSGSDPVTQRVNRVIENISKEEFSLSRNTYLKILKIAVGSSIAFAIASALGLQYAASAAIVTLLTIQNTKRATFQLALKRLLSFLVTIGLAFVIYPLLGCNAPAFALVMLLLVGISYKFKWHDAISVNAVIATHYLVEQNFTLAFVGNEAAMVFIGTVVAMVLNSYMPDGVSNIKTDIHAIENRIQQVLRLMADYLKDKADLSDCEIHLHELARQLDKGLEKAFENRDNRFSSHTRYYIEYMEMRKSQCQVLEGLLDSCHILSELPKESQMVSAFLRHMADSFHERNNVQELLEQLLELIEEVRQEPLPQTREEFEDRAIVFHILLDLEEFLVIKREFVENMTEEEVLIYWNDDFKKYKSVKKIKNNKKRLD